MCRSCVCVFSWVTLTYSMLSLSMLHIFSLSFYVLPLPPLFLPFPSSNACQLLSLLFCRSVSISFSRLSSWPGAVDGQGERLGGVQDRCGTAGDERIHTVCFTRGWTGHLRGVCSDYQGKWIHRLFQINEIAVLVCSYSFTKPAFHVMFTCLHKKCNYMQRSFKTYHLPMLLKYLHGVFFSNNIFLFSEGIHWIINYINGEFCTTYLYRLMCSPLRLYTSCGTTCGWAQSHGMSTAM